MKLILKISALIFLGSLLYAAEQKTADLKSPVGQWETIDDKTHKVTSTVTLWIEKDGVLHGKVADLVIDPGDDPNPVCDKCKGEKKDKPVKGMEILWGFKPERKGNLSKWVSGKILDPDEGEVYSCILTLKEDGKSLVVRGYIGIPLLGRSQTWVRVADK